MNKFRHKLNRFSQFYLVYLEHQLLSRVYVFNIFSTRSRHRLIYFSHNFLRKGRKEIIACHISAVKYLQCDGGMPANFKGQANRNFFLHVCSANHGKLTKSAVLKGCFIQIHIQCLPCPFIPLKNCKPQSNNQPRGSMREQTSIETIVLNSHNLCLSVRVLTRPLVP